MLRRNPKSSPRETMSLNFAIIALMAALTASSVAAADLSPDVVSAAKQPDKPSAAKPPETGSVQSPADSEIHAGNRAAHWTTYRAFKFDFDSADILAADRATAAEIAAFAAKNPQFQIGLDGSADPHGPLLHDQTLTDRRINAVRDALIKAGVEEAKIHAGAFADPDVLRDRQVEVVLSPGD